MFSGRYFVRPACRTEMQSTLPRLLRHSGALNRLSKPVECLTGRGLGGPSAHRTHAARKPDDDDDRAERLGRISRLGQIWRTRTRYSVHTQYWVHRQYFAGDSRRPARNQEG